MKRSITNFPVEAQEHFLEAAHNDREIVREAIRRAVSDAEGLGQDDITEREVHGKIAAVNVERGKEDRTLAELQADLGHEEDPFPNL